MEHISAYTEEKSKQLARGPRFVRWAVMLGIVIVLNVFFLVIRDLAFPQPQYTDYCPATPAPQRTDAADCAAAGGVWTPNTPMGYCDTTTKCNNAFEAADTTYRLHGFIVLLGLGVLAIIVGVIPLGSSIVSSGLSYGGVLAFIIASAQYWSDADSWLRFGISFIALIALIYIGLKRFRD